MKKNLKIILSITMLILVGFLFKAFSDKNYEFLGYWVVLVVLFMVVIKLADKYNLPSVSVILFSLWSVMHMGGGLIKINGIRLYDTILIDLVGDPFFIFKYDQLMHAFCYVAITMIVYFIMKNYIKNKKALFVFSVLVGMGIGAMNEIIELFMVVFAGAKDAVGDYYNNALDLIFNLIGAIIGSVWASGIESKK